MSQRSTNPTTGEVLREYAEASDHDLSRALSDAKRESADWRRVGFHHRAQLLRRAAGLLRERKEAFARLMALEMGKPVAQGRAEVDKCAWVSDYYAEHAHDFLAAEPVATDASRSFVTYEPLGPILAVMPWNFPLWQVFRFAAPTLMAGNVALLKHASNVPGSALAIQNAFRDAGFPAGTFRTVLVGASRVAELIASPEVRAVTLTGSTPAGRAVAEVAGRHLKKTVLELGGSDPYVILEDADLDLAVETCVAARLINGGQSCIAAKRFVVVEAVARSFQEAFVEKMRAKRMGDPLDDASDLGPQARTDLRADLQRQVDASVARGAQVLLGGEIPPGPGAFYPPTVLSGVRKGMPAYDEELFGPVASLITVKDEAEAVDVANDTAFGLGAAVFTRDVERGERLAATELEAGACFVNAFVKSDPRLPFGGIKDSGYGRELAAFGIREFVNVKTVYVR